jgi:hypothetical protein
LAIASKALSSKVNFTSSIANNFLYCLISAFFGSVNIFIKSSLVSSLWVEITGNLPINSGIRPYFTKSSGSTNSKISSLESSPFFSLPNPITLPFNFFLIISSSPSKAPPAINKMFEVSTWINSAPGCFLPPWGGTFTTVPSTILSRACWTPSPLTSLVILLFSPSLAILSISSIKIIPFSALSISKSAAWSSFNTTFSTSSPTYPASVRLVASAIAKGTSKNLANVCAIRVLPLPVGPITKIFDFCSSVSSSSTSFCLKSLL